MALTIDSQMAAAAGAGVSAVHTLTYAFNNVAGTLLIVGVSWGDTGTFTVASVTYNGVAMTLGVSVGFDGGSHDQSGAALYYLLSPATGSNNVVITMVQGDFSGQGIESGAMSFTGHDLVTPIVAGSGKTNFRESLGATATVTSGTTTVGNIAVAQMTTGAAYVSTTVGTLTWSKNQNTLSAGGNGAMTYASGTGGAIGFSDTIAPDFMGMVCLEVAAAGGGGGGRGLFRTPPMSGLGGGGSFFRDALSAPMQMVRRDRIFVPAWLGEAA